VFTSAFSAGLSLTLSDWVYSQHCGTYSSWHIALPSRQQVSNHFHTEEPVGMPTTTRRTPALSETRSPVASFLRNQQTLANFEHSITPRPPRSSRFVPVRFTMFVTHNAPLQPFHPREATRRYVSSILVSLDMFAALKQGTESLFG